MSPPPSWPTGRPCSHRRPRQVRRWNGIERWVQVRWPAPVRGPAWPPIQKGASATSQRMLEQWRWRLTGQPRRFVRRHRWEGEAHHVVERERRVVVERAGVTLLVVRRRHLPRSHFGRARACLGWRVSRAMDLPVRTFAILERARAVTRLPWPVVPRFRARCVTALGSSGGTSGGSARVRAE